MATASLTSSRASLWRLLFLLLPLTLLATAACQQGGNERAAAAAPAGTTTDAAADAAHAEEEPELAVYMSQMQRWAHKTALAAQAQNKPLADFYLHELEETVGAVQSEVPTYEGHAIGQLTEQMLVPSLDSLDAVVDAEDWTEAGARLRQVARSCNQCHAATDHGFVQIQLDGVENPYAQSFEKSAAGAVRE